VAPGKVQVNGRVETGGQKASVENVLRAVKGVESVENLIEVVPLRPMV